jgi:DNA-binding protein H-NS
MTVKELEQRVIELERQVEKLQRARTVERADRGFDWERVVDEYKNDKDILAVLSDAMKLREKERRAVRRKQSKSRRPRS